MNDNYSGCLLKMNFKGNNELHPKNPVTYVFNVEVSPHVCSFCHGFGHLLANCPNRSSQVEIHASFSIALHARNPPIAIVLSYPNIVPRNYDSHLGIEGDKGEFPRFSNPT